MGKESKKSYYAIIPADVRYDEDLPAGAKLLYGEITALCGKEGHCWASNSYFAELYNKGNRTITRWISALIEQGHIQADVEKEAGNQRRIYLTSAMAKNGDTYRQKCPYPIAKNGDTYRQKCPYPIAKNGDTLKPKMAIPIDKNGHHNNKDNNTSNITDNNTFSQKIGLSTKDDQHCGFTLLLSRGVDEQVARSLVYKHHTTLASIEEVVKNGLAKEDEAHRNGGDFRLEPGYIVKSLNQARREGKIVRPTKLSRNFSAKLKASRKYEPLSKAEFQKRKNRQLAELKKA